MNLDVALQVDRVQAQSYLVVGNHSKNFSPEQYLYVLEFPKCQRAFALACSNALPSALLEGRYTWILYSQCVCPYPLDSVKTFSRDVWSLYRILVYQIFQTDQMTFTFPSSFQIILIRPLLRWPIFAPWHVEQGGN